MTDELSTEYAKAITAQWGIQLQSIPRSNDKTPDFEFTCGSEHYVVEMKDRVAEWKFSESEAAAFEAGDIVHKSEGIGYHASLASNIKKASRQIEAYEPGENSFRLIWYFALGERAHLAAQRIMATLLGDIPVFELETGRRWPAYFYNDNLFTRLSDKIDGALVVAERAPGTFNVEFALNPYSPRYASLQQSHLAALLCDGLLDPFEDEKVGEALIVDSKADRASERATLNYLGEKYNIKVPQTIHMGHMAAVIRSDAGGSQSEEERA